MKKLRILLLAVPMVFAFAVLFPNTFHCGEKPPRNGPATLVTEDAPPLDPKQIDTTKTWIKIEKTNYLLHLYEGDKAIRSYPVVLGPDPVNDKKMEGDGCTPEGSFKIQSKYPHKSWSRFLWIDYPNADSRRKFKERKARGEIPSEAKIGGEIGIHGVPVGYNSIVDEGQNWTLGCISLKTEHILELYGLVPQGSTVEIVR